IAVTKSAGKEAGELISAAVSEPPAEGSFKGIALLGFFYFLRGEFDGVVDGIIYASLYALGVAPVEDVGYYAPAAVHGKNAPARAASQGKSGLAGAFVLRGVFTPWLHPRFTSMTGIGFGLSRESHNPYVRALAPIGGFAVAVSLHAMWNFLPTALGEEMGAMLI